MKGDLPQYKPTARQGFAPKAVRLVQGGTAAGILLSIGGWLAPVAWPFELMCHFRVQYALALGLCSALLCRLKPRWAVAALAVALFNSGSLAPYYWPPRVTSARTTAALTPLRLVSANLHSGNRHPERALEFLSGCNADVIIALEVTSEWELRLATWNELYPYSAVQSRGDNFGIAIYSRLPLTSHRFVPLGNGSTAIVAIVGPETSPLTIIAAHPFPPGGRRTAVRDSQLAKLSELAAQADGLLIIAGDLNITSFSPAFGRLLTQARVRDSRLGQGIQPTWPARRFPLRIAIDHCLVSDTLRVRARRVGPEIGSDHLPIVVDLMVPSGP